MNKIERNRRNLDLLFKMTTVALRWCWQQSIIYADYIIEAFVFSLPFDVGFPQFIRSKFQATCLHRTFKLWSDKCLIFRIILFNVRQVMNPQIHRQWYGFQSSLEYLSLIWRTIFGKHLALMNRNFENSYKNKTVCMNWCNGDENQERMVGLGLLIQEK